MDLVNRYELRPRPGRDLKMSVRDREGRVVPLRLTSAPTGAADDGIESDHLGAMTRDLLALAARIDGLSRSDSSDARQFVHLDMAARHALAAAHAISQLDGAGFGVAGQPPPAMAGAPDSEYIGPELALSLIRRIFATGLRAAALQSLVGDRALSDKAAVIVEELDLVIRDIRAGLMDGVGGAVMSNVPTGGRGRGR